MEYKDLQSPTLLNLEKIAKSFTTQNEINNTQEFGPEFDYVRDIFYGLKTLKNYDESFENEYLDFAKLYAIEPNDYERAPDSSVLNGNALIVFMLNLNNIILKLYNEEIDTTKKEFLLKLLSKITEFIQTRLSS